MSPNIANIFKEPSSPKSLSSLRRFDSFQSHDSTHHGQFPVWETVSFSTEDSAISDSFVKTIRVLNPSTSLWVIARSTFDTGSTYNWISKQFLEQRLRISYHELPQKRRHACIAFSGHVVVPLGFVKLLWYDAEGAGRVTYETQFLVCDQQERLFDLIVGSRTITRERILSWRVTTVWGSTQVQPSPVIGKREWSISQRTAAVEVRSINAEFTLS